MQVRFHAIAAGGEAVGRDETGRAFFAPLAAPGDAAEVELLSEHRSFGRGRVLRLVEASPQRITPPCPYFGPHAGSHDKSQGCGGCQLQHLDYPAQLAAKTQIVRDALTRIARIDALPLEPCIPSPEPFGYRNKAELKVDANHLGFFERESHRIADVAHCPIQHDANNALLHYLREHHAEGNLPSDLSGITLRVASGGEALLRLIAPQAWDKGHQWARQALQDLPFLHGVVQQHGAEHDAPLTWLSGQYWLAETIGNLTFRVSGFGFFQVNTALTPRLVATVLGFVEQSGGDGQYSKLQRSALDLFCGVGLFGLHLARIGWQVSGVEANSQAIEDARFNAAQHGLKAHFEAGDAGRALSRWRHPLDLVVLDPPRRGAAECIAPLLQKRPARVVYVSCDPATLARDIKALSSMYRLTRAVPLDMFPQTGHVETVALLERQDF